MAKNICHICGIPLGMFPLCKKHLQLKKDGKVIKNKYGHWVEIKTNKNL